MDMTPPVTVWKRDFLLRAIQSLESSRIPGSWRLRRWFEARDWMPATEAPICCLTNYGVKIVIQPQADRGVELAIFRTGAYEDGTLAVMASVLRAGGRFVDVGANVGLMSLVAARCVGPQGQVDSFEPLPEIRALLTQSLRVNGFGQVRLHGCALGSAKATLEISRHPEVNRGSASLAWSAPVAAEKSAVAVERLDDVLGEAARGSIDMIKVDVEGWEFEALKGAQGLLSAERQPVVCIEFSTEHALWGGTHAEMFRTMVDMGYRGFKLARSKASSSPLVEVAAEALPDHDNLFFFPSRRLQDFPPGLFARGLHP